MKQKILSCLFLCSLTLSAENIINAEEVNTHPYSEAEKQKLVDKLIEKFANEKHKNKIIHVPPMADENDDYLKESEEINDPLEGLNRAIHTFNGILDFLFLEPLSYMYRDALPNPVQKSFSNFWTNLQAPLYCLNHLFQANMNDFFQTGVSFLVNSTFGLLGFFDISSDVDLKRTSASFDQTLACWGIPAGPYLVVPIFGASSLRGGVSIVGDMFLDPISWYTKSKARDGNNNYKHFYYAAWGIHLVDTRSTLIDYINAEVKPAKDPYAVIRSATNQRRIAMENELKSR
ncbi:MAG: VacJ family lipoprotein [Proteobacteria bacterium]|nr:VacJ family lipoprotein [Pseudomonadota bacterium]